jgi:hypothetical protein
MRFFAKVWRASICRAYFYLVMPVDDTGRASDLGVFEKAFTTAVAQGRDLALQ